MSNKVDVIAAIESSLAVAQALSVYPPPEINSATVTPSALPYGGGPVVVDAAVRYADAVFLNDAPVTLPTPPFTVTVDTQLVLRAVGPGGTTSVTLSVDVAAAPPAPTITDLRCDPNPLPAGGGATRISATVTDATTITLNNRVVTLPWTENIFTTTRFVVVATNAVGVSDTDEVTAVVPVVVPEPTLPVVQTRLLTRMSRLIMVASFMPSPDRYNRAQFLTVVKPDAAGALRVRVFSCDLAGGGGAPLWGAAMPLTLRLERPDGTLAIQANATTDPAQKELYFSINAAQVEEGWYKADVVGGDAFGWDCCWWAVFVLKSAVAPPHALMPSVTASYELMHQPTGSPWNIQFAWVPTLYAPTEKPLAMREYPNVVTQSIVGVPAISRDMLVCDEIAPYRATDPHRPVVSAEGIWSTFNTQNYNFYDFEAKVPIWPLLDGVRGRGTLTGLMHVEWGTAVVNSPPFNGPVDNLYFTDTWRFGKILLGKYRSADYGKVVTLCGFRHPHPPPYRYDVAGNPAAPELVGNWDAIPPERRGACRMWGIGWDSRAFVSDLNAPTIPAEKDLHPHASWPDSDGTIMAAGIRVFLPDLTNNRVLKLQFNPTSHATPPVVTEFAIGLNRPFDNIEVEKASGFMAVTDTGNNRVIVVSLDDGAAIVAQFATLAPEGIAYQDGWLYYGSIRAKNIKKRTVTINTGSVTFGPEVVAVALQTPYQINDNSRYVKIALSDGSFGPRGMIGVMTWSNIYYGLPLLFLPGENVIKHVDFIQKHPARSVRGPICSGEAALSYGTAIGFGHGSMFSGTTQEGLLRWSGVVPSDAVLNGSRYNNGVKLWRDKGLHLTRGNHGWGFDGAPPPWGVHADIDYMMEVHGHTRS